VRKPIGVATRPFLDTSILIYGIGGDHRSARSRELLASGGIVSVQVLNEFVSTSRRKYALSWDGVEEWLAAFRAALEVEPLTVEIQARATALARRHQTHIYDATIIAAAEQAGCDVLYTEDMQHGAAIAGVEIRNPY